VQIAWRAQRRPARSLGQRRGKPTGTVAIACARELAAFCWEAATLDRHRPRQPDAPGGCRGAHEHNEGRHVAIHGPANKGYGQPGPQAGRRPILGCEPGDEQGS
jgi:hypothetical protein